MAEITLIATSHIAQESINTIKSTIHNRKPQCVAVELDLARFHMLTHESKQKSSLKGMGISTILLMVTMKKLQSWLGNKVGILPGSEMLTAVSEAQRHGAHVAFIDMHIAQTVQNINALGARKKLKLLWFIAKGLLQSVFHRGEQSIDLSKVPPKEIIKEAMTVFKKEFPELYDILVTKRNHYMAHNINHLQQKYENIVVVIGAGHEEGIRKLLEKP